VTPEGHQREGRQQCSGDENRENREIHQASFGHVVTSFRSVELEADVLEGVGGLAVEPSGCPIVPASCRKVPLGDPRRRAMAP
jgi:hypothetical protein